jgi:hypothetical protein
LSFFSGGGKTLLGDTAEPGPKTVVRSEWTPDQQRTASALRSIRGTQSPRLRSST